MLIKKKRVAWNKGLKTGLVPKTAFKKGFTPWNKGIPFNALEKHHNWKGGRCLIKDYWYVKIPGHPSANCNNYVREHRYVMEQSIGRYLTRTEVVHHINGDHKDNRIENLELIENHAKHMKLHQKERDHMGRFI